MIDATLVDKAGLKLIGELTKLTVGQGETELRGLGQFSPDEISQLVLLCKGTAAPAKETYYADRRKVICALWILGASWLQIAHIYGVAKQTICQSARRELGPYNTRLATRCLHGRVAEYNAAFWQNREELASSSPPVIAEWLLTNTEVDE